jgi:hypothetical protein
MSGGSTFHGTRHHMLRHMTLVCSVRNRYPSRTLYRMELQSIASTDKSTRIQGRSMALHRRRLLQARDTDQCLVPDTSSQVLVTLVYGRWLLPCLGIQMDRPPVAAHRLSGYRIPLHRCPINEVSSTSLCLPIPLSEWSCRRSNIPKGRWLRGTFRGPKVILDHTHQK